MSNIVVINCTAFSPYAFKEIAEGINSLQRVLQVASQFPEIEKIVLLGAPDKLPNSGDMTEVFPAADLSEVSLFSSLIEVSKGYERIFYLFGDTPMMDRTITELMYKNHKKYFAQYSFADGYPLGLTPEILDTAILPALKTLAEQQDGRVDRKSIFTVLSRDINSFDIETQISPDDQRLLRVSLTADKKRNFLLLQRILSENPRTADDILAIIRRKPGLLRTLPAYAEIQVTSGWVNKPEYLPGFPGETFNRRDDTHLEPEAFALILDKLETLSSDMVINPGFRCEPSLHPEILELITLVLDKPDFQIIIETSGRGWGEEVLKGISQLESGRIRWIIELDGADPEVYTKIRGTGFDEAERFAQTMLDAYPGQVWVQAVRLKGFEKEIEEFYRKWKEKTESLIIQKFNDYAGALPSRKVTDLSPLKRFACWHLKRDMNILLDGTVLSCGEVLDSGGTWGNILEESAEQIWKQGEPLYAEHVRGNYPSLCGGCDEYYTFNF